MRALERVKHKTRLALLRANFSEREMREIKETDLATLETKVYNLSYNQTVISSTLTTILEDITALKTRVNNLENKVNTIPSNLTQSINNINNRLTALETK